MNESAAAAERAAGAVELTGRQREVVGLIALGLTAQEIGVELGISARTARAHTDVIRRKLGASRARQIPRTYWRRTGINPLELRG
jgi:DNA-binding CsgD family transcriptional regulator